MTPQPTLSDVVKAFETCQRLLEQLVRESSRPGASSASSHRNDEKLPERELDSEWLPCKTKAQAIISRVCQTFDVPEALVLQRVRWDYVCRARHAAYWLVSEACHLSSPQLGRLFKRNHCTILCGIRQAHARYDTDRSYRELVEKCKTQL